MLKSRLFAWKKHFLFLLHSQQCYDEWPCKIQEEFFNAESQVFLLCAIGLKAWSEKVSSFPTIL